jgi:hypothetical protein
MGPHLNWQQRSLADRAVIVVTALIIVLVVVLGANLLIK